MPDTTTRHALPLLSALQAQKEITHNEALTRLDALVAAAVVAAGVNTPPAAPASGEAWIVGAAPTGAWAQHSDEIAAWSAGGWTFLKPVAGYSAWNRADGAPMVFDGTRWRADAWPSRKIEIAGKTVVSERRPAIGAPAGGSVIDVEARSVLSQVLITLRAHGLIES